MEFTKGIGIYFIFTKRKNKQIHLKKKTNMQFEGVTTKMKTQYNQPVQYILSFQDDFIMMNQLLGRHIEISFKNYECLNCHKNKKIFRQGFCFDCFQSSPRVGDWIMKPELSKAHLDEEDRDLAYEKKVQLQPHIIYIANSSNPKVGVTRKSQIPTRWIDQGAHEAVVLAEVPNRYLAGIGEVALKDHLSDKTKWRQMLQNKREDVDLVELAKSMRQYLPEEVQKHINDEPKLWQIQFPVNQYPQQLKSLNFEKTPDFDGVLVGIKGQYLIFEDQTVFNVRNSEGYILNWQIGIKKST
jgi:hypothetical protein